MLLIQDADVCNDCSPKKKLKVSLVMAQEEKQPSSDLQGIIDQIQNNKSS